MNNDKPGEIGNRSINTHLAEAIKKASDAEDYGHRFYKAQAESSTNPLTKALLEELAEDELRHCMWFKALGREATGEPDPSVEAGCATLEDRLKAVFNEMDESAKGRTDRSQEDVLKEAVRLEKESYATYDGLFKESSGPTRNFFDRMRREEYEHLVALENTLMYLSKTGTWFDIEESKRWNWMNI